MRHFHRTTSMTPAAAIAAADDFFKSLGFTTTATAARSRTFTGPLGTLKLTAKPEGGHYTFIEVVTDQIGESRLDKNVKKFFVRVHRAGDPGHAMQASY